MSGSSVLFPDATGYCTLPTYLPTDPPILAVLLKTNSMCPGGNVTVGVTSDSMLKKKANAEMVSSLPERVEGVKDFLRSEPECTYLYVYIEQAKLTAVTKHMSHKTEEYIWFPTA